MPTLQVHGLPDASEEDIETFFISALVEVANLSAAHEVVELPSIRCTRGQYVAQLQVASSVLAECLLKLDGIEFDGHQLQVYQPQGRPVGRQDEKTAGDRSLESLIDPDVFSSEVQLRQNQRETFWTSKSKRPASGTIKRPSFKVLNVARRATKAEVKRAYVQLMRSGADKGELNEAYKIM